jgi:hypothetical protein
MKEGDKIYCHTGIYDWTTKGQTYTIIEINYDEGSVVIIDDECDRNHFSTKNDNTKFKAFHQYFYTDQDIRKQKILKINKHVNR